MLTEAVFHNKDRSENPAPSACGNVGIGYGTASPGPPSISLLTHGTGLRLSGTAKMRFLFLHEK